MKCVVLNPLEQAILIDGKEKPLPTLYPYIVTDDLGRTFPVNSHGTELTEMEAVQAALEQGAIIDLDEHLAEQAVKLQALKAYRADIDKTASAADKAEIDKVIGARIAKTDAAVVMAKTKAAKG